MIDNSGDSQRKKPDLDVLAKYEELLEDYNRILEVSSKVLDEVKKEFDEEALLPLLERKLEIADRISKTSKRASQIELAGDSPIQLEIIKQAKRIIAQIKNRADLLLKCENKIEQILKDKGLKIR